jgi:hypothetical protein
VTGVFAALMERQEESGNDLDKRALTEQSHYNIAATAGYFLTAKAVRMSLYVYYGIKLPVSESVLFGRCDGIVT